MPIIIVEESGHLKGQPVLRCINHIHGALTEQHKRSMNPDTFTTMEVEGQWLALMGIMPPQSGVLGAPSAPPIPARFTGTYGQALRTYTCRVCGYVEMYDGQIIAPDIWKRGG